MGTIQASVGLVTGVPTTQTIDQLIAISAQPRDLVVSRANEASSEQIAITELTASVIATQLSFRSLGRETSYDQRSASSSNSSALSVTATGDPALGSYQYTPIQQAQSHQLLSSGFATSDQAIGAGELKLRFGGFIDQTRNLDDLNGGTGIQRGQIRVTDRSGSTAVVDLRFAKTVDDVLEAITNHSDINVTAVADGDRIKIVDNTGQTTSNLIVQQVGSDTTASDLGLSGISVAANEATGQDVLSLYDNVALSTLNGGNGVVFGASTDLKITLRDASTLDIDLTSSSTPTTLGAVVDAINAADPAKLSAAISASGDTIEITDLTGGSGDLTIADGTGSSAATDLGIATTISGNTITSRQLQSGLKTSLLSTLGGGQGLGTLGNLVVTDRAGGSDTIDLSSASTLDDVINAINAASANVTASVNSARNGILLTDTSGGSGNLVVANDTDSTETADKLGVAVNSAVSSVDSGSLGLQIVNENTLLSSLNRGDGVQLGSFTIKDTTGATSAINLTTLGATTVGDVIDAVNALGLGLVAEINAEGDGIRLRDTASGTEDITVTDAGSGTAAADLGIAGSSTLVDVSGTQTKVISGSSSITLTISDTDSLSDVVNNINALGAGISASLFDDGGSGNRYRLSLVSQTAGSAGELLIDATGVNFEFDELAKAQDALLLVGSADIPGAGFLASSSSNQFTSILDGATLTINDATGTSVSVDIRSTNSQLLIDAGLFVDSFNSLRDKLDDLTFFSEVDNTIGILFGSNEALRVETELTQFLSGRHFGLGSIRSLAEVGITFDSEGKLELDTAKLEAKFAEDPAALEQFFTGDNGVAAKFDELVETLAGEESSLLVNRAGALQRKIDDFNQRIIFMNERLEAERTLLVTQFTQMELIIGQLQNNLSVLEALQPVPALVSV